MIVAPVRKLDPLMVSACAAVDPVIGFGDNEVIAGGVTGAFTVSVALPDEIASAISPEYWATIVYVPAGQPPTVSLA